VDFEIGLRHQLPIVDVLNADGTLNAAAGDELAGLDRFAGRKKAAELLRGANALVGEEAYTNNVGYSERADVPIEPRLTWQWWLKYPRVEEAKAAVRDGHIKFFPDRWSKVYLHWMENIQDWCISRQLWWGHRIPVWYRKGLDREALTPDDLKDPAKVHVSLAGPADPENWEQEEDVLDTWASSWLWPLATMGWPDRPAMREQGFDYFYPTTTLVTGPDIIFFWVARMIMAGLEFGESEGFATGPATAAGAETSRSTLTAPEIARRIPFKHVYFTGIIRDAQGRKMSKSLGNSPDPLDLIEKYGADGLRFGIISIAPQGQDIRFQEDRIEGGKNFCNKLWNACRFRQISGPAGDNSSLTTIVARLAPTQSDADDHAILDRLLGVTHEVERCFEQFEFSAAVQALYGFFWNDFCDWYVEVSKAKLQDEVSRGHCLAIQDLVLRQTLLLLHPFIPFITQELWTLLGYGSANSLIQDARIETGAGLADAFATASLLVDRAAAESVGRIKDTVSRARALKADYNLASRRDVKFFVVAADADWVQVEANLAKLLRMTGAAEISRREAVDGAPAVVTPVGTFYLDLASTVDAGAEKQRLAKELESLRKHVAGTESRLANQAFVSKAPPAVIEGARKQLADLQAKAAEIERLLAAL
ncbi:MAG TPA: class I tRNA ligase family protein, partial [Candidatus Synoicihabitans sp.]|nr:class I tRNA ligase family protein [Candidatus Synoicihabitans sp.]